MSWMAGSLWEYQADITNGAGGAGDHSYTVTPGVGNELWILYGEVLNGDTATRTVTMAIDTGADQLYDFSNEALGAGVRAPFPGRGASTVPRHHNANYYMLAGAMRFIVTIAAVALSQNTALGLVARIKGGAPTVAEAGASTPTININTEQVI